MGKVTLWDAAHAEHRLRIASAAAMALGAVSRRTRAASLVPAG